MQLLPNEPNVVACRARFDGSVNAKLAPCLRSSPVLQSIRGEFMKHQCQGMGLSFVEAHGRSREVAGIGRGSGCLIDIEWQKVLKIGAVGAR